MTILFRDLLTFNRGQFSSQQADPDLRNGALLHRYSILIKLRMVPDKNKEVEEEIMDDESCRLIMKERADLAGITSAYFEHSSIHGLRHVFKSFFLVS